MDGYEIEPGELTALAGKVTEIGEMLGKAGTSIGGAIGGDLGHDSIAAAVQQVLTGMRDEFGTFSEHANGMSQNLIGTRQQYLQGDSASAGQSVGVGSAAEGAFDGVSGGDDIHAIPLEPSAPTPEQVVDATLNQPEKPFNPIYDPRIGL